jgi:hypothetical protein
MSEYFLFFLLIMSQYIYNIINLSDNIINIIWGFDIFGGVRGLTFY